MAKKIAVFLCIAGVFPGSATGFHPRFNLCVLSCIDPYYHLQDPFTSWDNLNSNKTFSSLKRRIPSTLKPPLTEAAYCE